ncbi:MAG: response regulator [Planctomycetes bacterium]|nr:response regulator [Planctomycetota bacterium]
MPRSVMLVDDNIGDVNLMRLAIEEIGWGVHVTAAADGLDALAFLDGDVVPDLMVIDLNMPRMNGWELLDRMLEDDGLRDIRRVVLTSSPVPDDASRALALGAERCFVKSPNFHGLVATARQIRVMMESGMHPVHAG